MAIAEKGSKLYGILHFKCPKCQEGDLFETGTLSFQKPFDMPENCPVCHQKYYPEPGFYYGAMFISYIITGWFCLFYVGFMMLVLHLSWQVAFTLLVITLALLFVWIFRLSRAIWLSLNVKYDKMAGKRQDG